MPSGYSVFTSCLFDPTKNKLDCYKSEDCMERFCKGLREHAIKIIVSAKPMKKMSLMESKKFVTYAKNNLILINLILMKTIKMNLILMKMIKIH